MSKLTSTSVPDLPTGGFSISGGPSAQYKDGKTTYTLNGSQQQAYDYAQKSFTDNMQNINTFLPETVAKLYDQVEAYKNNALDTLNSTYTPLLRNTRNDAAQRFGNLDNSVFLDNYGSVEKQRGKAMSQLAQDVTATQQNLYNQELQNQYNYLNFLNSYNNQVFSQATQAGKMANSAAEMQNKFAYQQYNAQNKNNGLDQMLALAALAIPGGGAAATGAKTALALGKLLK